VEPPFPADEAPPSHAPAAVYLPPPVPRRSTTRAPFLLVSALLAVVLLIVTGAMLASEFLPDALGWGLFLASVTCLLLVLMPRQVEPQDPAGATFTAFGATVLLALLLYNGTMGASMVEREFAGHAVVGLPSEPSNVVLLRPTGDERQFAFVSAELRSELAGLAGAEVQVRMLFTRRFGAMHTIALLELAGRERTLGAIGWVDGEARRVRAPGGPPLR
jgi:hypothetical protein